MGGFMEWQNLVFEIWIIFGLLLMFGAVLGFDGHAEGPDAHVDVGHGAHHGAGHDAHHGAGHDAHHDHDGGVLKAALSILGVGRIPLMLLLTLMSMTFGLTGYFMNSAIAPAMKEPWVYFWISFIVSLVVMVAVTGSLARVIGRVMPKTELHRVDDRDLEGRVGRLVVSADARSGFVDVRDGKDNLHRVSCRTAQGELPKGSEVLLVEFDDKARTYLIQPHDSEKLVDGATEA